jgi:ubiquinone/menaquinone biosynthesis C-methylase UbiE
MNDDGWPNNVAARESHLTGGTGTNEPREPDMSDVYSHGHHESVLRSHRWRTAANSAAYLLPHLRPGQELLDVGCGPGNITIDLARRVAPGRVFGIDVEAGIVEAAARANEWPEQVRFCAGDVYALDFPDASFDVVHAHQVLQHLSDPVAALSEMRRVLRPDGILAVRDSDYSCFSWAPLDPLLTRWNEIYHAIARQNRAEPDAGRFLLGWAQRAGFREIHASSSTWTYADPESRAWWGGLWADRVTSSSYRQQALEYGLASPDELAEIAAAWRRWAGQPDGWYAVLHGEVLARA